MKIPGKESIKFHIDADDYFATLATVLDLIVQQSEKTIKELNDLHKINAKQLKSIKNDLMFLQKRYKIIKKHFTKNRSACR